MRSVRNDDRSILSLCVSVADQLHFDTDPDADADPRIHTSAYPDRAIFISGL